MQEKLKNFYKIILNNLHDGIYVVNKNQQIVYWNKTCEQLTGYQADSVINKHCYDDILHPIDDNGINLCKNGCPAVKTLENGIIKTEELYIHHKNGHRVPVKTKITPICDETNEIIGAVHILADNSEKISLLDKLKRVQGEALLDKLTGIGNRSFIQSRLEERLKELKRYGWKFGILFIDIDNFKQINDTYGHKTGDKVLKMISQTIQKDLRSFDTVGRWGGDEFIAIIVNVSTAELKKVAARLRKLINNSYLTINKEKVNITVSIGGTTADKNDTTDNIITRADDKMYTSKSKGKDTITI